MSFTYPLKTITSLMAIISSLTCIFMETLFFSFKVKYLLILVGVEMSLMKL